MHRGGSQVEHLGTCGAGCVKVRGCIGGTGSGECWDWVKVVVGEIEKGSSTTSPVAQICSLPSSVRTSDFAPIVDG